MHVCIFYIKPHFCRALHIFSKGLTIMVFFCMRVVLGLTVQMVAISEKSQHGPNNFIVVCVGTAETWNTALNLEPRLSPERTAELGAGSQHLPYGGPA